MELLLHGLLSTAVGILACAPPPQGQPATDVKARLRSYVDAWNRHDSLALDTLLA
jgi:membrane protein required for beta-lactamase induction